MRARILIVDDDELYLEAMQEWIALAGYEPSGVSTFEDAPRAIGETQPDLLTKTLGELSERGSGVA